MHSTVPLRMPLASLALTCEVFTVSKEKFCQYVLYAYLLILQDIIREMSEQENNVFQHIAPSSISLASTSTTFSSSEASTSGANMLNLPDGSPDLIQWFANNFDHIVEALRRISQLSSVSTTQVSVEMLRDQFPVFGSVLDFLVDLAFSIAYFDITFTWTSIYDPGHMAAVVNEATDILLRVNPVSVELGKQTTQESSP